MAWLTGWDFRKKITVQSANIDSNLTAFPVYVYLNADADIGDEARADGYDIRFTQSDGETLLKYERESWTGGAGDDATAHFWVKSNLTSASGATIYLYYGKSDATDGDDKNNVWDANFEAVYHLHADFNDSTSNGVNLTKSGAGVTHVSGKVANAAEFERASSEYAYNTSDPLLDGGAPFTMECWLYSGTIDGNYFVMSSLDNTDWNKLWSLRGDFPNAEFELLANDETASEATTSNSLSSSTWGYLVGVEAATNNRSCYLDADVANKGTDTTSVNPSALVDRFGIGALVKTGPTTTGHWDGLMDEVRVSSTDRSEAYIKFVNANITEADNELTWTAEEIESSADAIFFGTDW